MATSPTQTVMLVPTLAPCASAACASELIEWLSPGWPKLVLHRHQINQREHKHPDQVDKVPVEAVDFDVLCGKLAAPVPHGHDSQVDHADHHVGHVQSGDAEEHGAEERGAFRISSDGE